LLFEDKIVTKEVTIDDYCKDKNNKVKESRKVLVNTELALLPLK